MHKLIVLLTLFSLIVTAPVTAHELVTHGSVGITLHIDPDDDPVAGDQSTFFMEFKDLQNKFSLVGCRCQVFIYQGEEELYFENIDPVNSDSPLSSAFQFKFPAKGIYRLKVQGDPVQAGTFTSFVVEQTIAVERERTGDTAEVKPDSLAVRLPYFMTIGIILSFLIGVAVVSMRNSKRKPTSK